MNLHAFFKVARQKLFREKWNLFDGHAILCRLLVNLVQKMDDATHVFSLHVSGTRWMDMSTMFSDKDPNDIWDVVEHVWKKWGDVFEIFREIDLVFLINDVFCIIHFYAAQSEHGGFVVLSS
jgi:hypothetical protein